jgi:hypothetical protein
MTECNVCRKGNPLGVEFCEDCGAALTQSAAAPLQSTNSVSSAGASDGSRARTPVTSPPGDLAAGTAIGCRLQAKRYGVVSTAEEIPLGGERLVVGRFDSETGPVDVDLAASPEAATVSRHHAELIRNAGGKWTVRDLGSTNGVYVKAATDSGFGPRIGEPRILNDGDELAFGNARFVFRAGS